jgi:hypothetical protein
MKVIYKAFIGSYSPDNVQDELFFDYVLAEHLIQGEWEIMCEFRNVEKIEDHITD